MYTRRKLTVYVANENPFPEGVQFVAYYHADNPQNSLTDPFFCEHLDRGDSEVRIWFARLSSAYTWDFERPDQVESRTKSFMMELDEAHWTDLQAFFENCMAAIEERPSEAFQAAFRSLVV
jgi:hypothetical protein